MDNLIVGLILIVIIGAAAWYVYKAKKSGKKCIGCPDGCSTKTGGCSGSCSGCGSHCSCHSDE